MCYVYGVRDYSTGGRSVRESASTTRLLRAYSAGARQHRAQGTTTIEIHDNLFVRVGNHQRCGPGCDGGSRCGVIVVVVLGIAVSLGGGNHCHIIRGVRIVTIGGFRIFRTMDDSSSTELVHIRM